MIYTSLLVFVFQLPAWSAPKRAPETVLVSAKRLKGEPSETTNPDQECLDEAYRLSQRGSYREAVKVYEKVLFGSHGPARFPEGISTYIQDAVVAYSRYLQSSDLGTSHHQTQFQALLKQLSLLSLKSLHSDLMIVLDSEMRRLSRGGRWDEAFRLYDAYHSALNPALRTSWGELLQSNLVHLPEDMLILMGTFLGPVKCQMPNRLLDNAIRDSRAMLESYEISKKIPSLKEGLVFLTSGREASRLKRLVFKEGAYRVERSDDLVWLSKNFPNLQELVGMEFNPGGRSEEEYVPVVKAAIAAVGNLKELHKLDLVGHLRGLHNPGTWWSLDALEADDLAPLKNLKKLRSLRLDDPFSQDLQFLPSLGATLEEVHLELLEAPALKNLKVLPHLKKMDISLEEDVESTVVAGVLESHPKLENLSLVYENREITSEIFEQLRNMSSLESLRLDYFSADHFSNDRFGALVRGMPHLRGLSLSDYDFNSADCGQWSDSVLKKFGEIQSLERLNLIGDMTPEGIKSLTKLSKIQQLFLGPDITDAHLLALEPSSFPDLKHLDLQGDFTKTGLASLKEFIHLETINVESSNLLEGELCESLSALGNLKKIGMYSLSDISPDEQEKFFHLIDLPRLSQIILGAEQIASEETMALFDERRAAKGLPPIRWVVPEKDRLHVSPL